MNNEGKVNDGNNVISTIIAWLFSNSDLNISPEFIKMGKLDKKMVYKVRIDYISRLVGDIVSIINMVFSKDPKLQKYVISEEKCNNINEVIKQNIKNDIRLRRSLILKGEYIVYNGKNIDINEFTGKDDNLIWLIKKIKMYANELISEYDIEAASKNGRSI